MSQQPPEDKKVDLSKLPRGAISMRGLPASRNARLPTIRTPRDLTLSGHPKKTYMPNIPVRRERRPQVPEPAPQIRQENVRSPTPRISERGRGRGRGKANYIQTEGGIFSEGIASLSGNEKMRRAYQKSEFSSPRGISIKKEKDEKGVAGISSKMDLLLRDDFIDDGDDDNDDSLLKPITFPIDIPIKKEAKSEIVEPAVKFDPNIAKEMNFDVNRVAQFIKKEKGDDDDDEKKSVLPLEGPSNDITNLLNIDADSSKLVLLKFPQFLNVTQKDDSEVAQKRTTADPKASDKTTGLSSINCLPEGYVGKLQILKSGKARLVIGPVEYILDSVNSLRQAKNEVVSIATKSSTGDMCVLGGVEDMLKFVPNEDSLLS